jgi:hypothetical protein
MAITNDIYYNAAFVGALSGMMNGRKISSATQADYGDVADAAEIFALNLDARIAFDALVTTAMAATQLAITTNTIAANEQWRAGLLCHLCHAVFAGSYTEDTTSAHYDVLAAAIKECWDEGLTKLVTP